MNLAELLFGPLLQATPGPRGWRLVSYDLEQGLCLTLGRDDDYLLIELEERSESRPCHARTAHFNICARPTRANAPLSRSGRAAIDQLVALVRAREQALPNFERPTSARRAAVRELRVDRLLIDEGNGQYYVNPYVGCTIGCRFCYVAERADLSRRLQGLPRLDWGRYVDVKINAAEVLAEEVARCAPGPVRLSPIITDPYQPLERKYRVTRACLEVLMEAGFSPIILTRAARVVEDIELLAGCAGAAVGFSIPTDDDRVRAEFEPGADPIEDRFAALAQLRDAGITTFAVVQPVLAMEPLALANRLAPLIDMVRVDRMYDIDKVQSIYEESGRESSASEHYFATTIATLTARFAELGVAVDDLDDLAAMTALASRNHHG